MLACRRRDYPEAARPRSHPGHGAARPLHASLPHEGEARAALSFLGRAENAWPRRTWHSRAPPGSPSKARRICTR